MLDSGNLSEISVTRQNSSQQATSMRGSAGDSAASKPRATSWLEEFISSTDARGDVPLHPSVQGLKELIESRAELRMWATAMFQEVPNKSPYNRQNGAVGRSSVRDYHHMLALISVIVNEVAPTWTMAAAGFGTIGLPFEATLDWAMDTPSGHAFFHDASVNAQLKVVLDAWRDNLLMTSKSRAVVTTDAGNWLSTEAVAAIERNANLDPNKRYTFEQLFRCDPAGDPRHWGFQSWDDFFVRQFTDMDALRPVGYPDNPAWVVNGCESWAVAIQTDVKRHDNFWLKGNRYSLHDMLDRHPLVDCFVGGTVHQSVLRVTAYHRWAASVSGHVVYAGVVPGRYFAHSPAGGLGAEPVRSPRDVLGSLTHFSTRALIFSQGDDPVGLMCFVAVGIADVSTCEIATKFMGDWPQPVRKGEELGMFHYGGSSQCLVFRKGLKLAFTDAAVPGAQKKDVAIRSPLAFGYAED